MTESAITSVQMKNEESINSEIDSNEKSKPSRPITNQPIPIRVLHMIIQFLLASLFTTSAFLISLQAKQLWYHYQFNEAYTLNEKTSPYYVHHIEGVWYKFSQQSSDHFEFSDGRLKVNTSLYAF